MGIIEKLIGLDFESKATYVDKYINTKIKTYKDRMITNFYNITGFKEMPEEKVPHKCLSMIILDSVLYAYKNCYPQTFLEECKYMRKNLKTKNYIDTELESESESESDNNIELELESNIDSDSNSGIDNEK